MEYSVELGEPIEGSYSLIATELPPGLTFDPATRTLSGKLNAPGTFRIRVEDADGNAVQETVFDVAARTSCWFGYISTQTGPALLHLVDPVLNTRLSLPPAMAETSRVTDFAFSADGRFVALRSADADGDGSLRLFAAPTWEEIRVDLPAPVSGYTWAAQAPVLAMSLRTAQGPTLGSVQLPGGTIALQAAPETIDAPLTWVGDSGVAYDAVALDTLPEDGLRSIRYSRWTGTGFSPITINELTYYAPGARLFGSPDGFYVLSSELVHFYDTTSATVRWIQHPTALISPSRRHLVRLRPGELDVFRATEELTDEMGFSLPVVVGAGCDRLLAWSRDDGKLACVTTTEYGGEVRIFEVNQDSTLRGPRTVRGNYELLYTPNESFTRPRVFSPQGNWLAFVTSDSLYLADLRSAPFIQERQESLTGNGAVRLAFSPDEQFLYVQRGERLSLLGISAPPFRPTLIDDEVAVDPGCTDGESAVATPDAWCGTGAASHVVWSPTSRALAYVRRDGAISLKAWSSLDAVSNTLACTTGCSGDAFAFQPSTPAH